LTDENIDEGLSFIFILLLGSPT